ncbi:hypothetical protein, partial [Huintestinicola sp.]|uniref:hypothetical protein n=1 Tax=Huintestinicola sp. TaxID=2981661 RepID=UPI003D7CBBFB
MYKLIKDTEKGLTFRNGCGKIIKLSVMKRKNHREIHSKKLKKDLKKVLTNRKECDIIKKFSPERK